MAQPSKGEGCGCGWYAVIFICIFSFIFSFLLAGIQTLHMKWYNFLVQATKLMESNNGTVTKWSPKSISK